MKFNSLIAVGIVTLAVGVHAGSQAQAPPVAASAGVFEVASIKPNPSRTGLPIVGVLPGGRFTAPNVSASTLILVAYGLQEYQLTGGPGWLASDRFEVSAAAGRTVTADEVRTMLRAMLAERFMLAVHTEMRPLPIYSLIGHGAPREGLRRAGDTCAPPKLPAGVPMPPPPPPGAAATTPLMPGNVPFSCASIFFPGQICARNLTMAQLVGRLSPLVQRPIMDRTGLSGFFDIDLVYTPDVPPPTTPGAPPIANDAPSIFTALQEQLGLKLETGTAPFDVTVVDRIERPSEN